MRFARSSGAKTDESSGAPRVIQVRIASTSLAGRSGASFGIWSPTIPIPPSIFFTR